MRMHREPSLLGSCLMISTNDSASAPEEAEPDDAVAGGVGGRMQAGRSLSVAAAWAARRPTVAPEATEVA